jgi:hypothetical protein
MNPDLLNPASIDVTLGGRIMVEVPETPELQMVTLKATRQLIRSDPAG